MTSLQLRNCEFAFECDAEWDKLAETENVKIRFCNDCEKQVHHCVDDKELVYAIRANLCVAIEQPYPQTKKTEHRMLMGSMRYREPEKLKET
jgi:hypothetical protein